MRIFTLSAFVTTLLLFSGCDQNQSTPSTPASNQPTSSSGNRPGVEIHTPNVDVNSNKEGTSVRTPGANVDIQKKQP